MGVRQRVEILKALYRGAKILVLDEPTTNLTPQEVDDLFSSMRAIVDDGMSVVLITHKIRETMEVCDRMTVMRDGRWIATVDKADTTADDLASTMIGEVAGSDADAAALAQAAQVALGEEDLGEASLTHALPAASEAEPRGGVADPVAQPPARVTVRGLTVAGPGGKPLVDDVTLDLRPGEILGIAGVAGNGQGEARRGTHRHPHRDGVAHRRRCRASSAGRPRPGWAAGSSTSPRTGSGTAYSPEPGSPRTSSSDRTARARRPG